MSSIPNLILTNAGATLLAKSPIGSPIPVTKWQIGTGVLADDADLRARTKLVSVFTERPIARVEPSGKECLVTGSFINTGFGAFTWSETGLFAQDPDDGEILYAYGNSGSSGGAIIPAGSEQYREIEFGVQLAFDVAANVVSSVSQSLIYATRADLQSKADLVGGQVPYAQTPHLTGNKTVYVDAALGNDANSGTQENPFKTIQAAVNALPKDLGAYTATINVAAGTYDEDVEFKGFSAGNVYQGIRLVGAESADTSRKVRTLRINGCSAFVKIQGFSFFGSAIGIAVEVCNARATLSSLIIKKSEADAATVGIAIGGHAPAQATISNCTVDGYQFGIRVDYSSLAGIIKTTVKNCTCGVEGGSSMTGTAGIAMLHQPTYEGNTSNTVAYYGGQIFGGV